ncbi:hypothetical protein SAY86_009089 [Trapa natans]|uniref:DOG1 domain-containing protein n=1 Tax=Trapa natans TaxID=22666 RepID=A0AAN7QBT2_TRANT|nr:hypothetical protein SAY86_009089 [Trapa natans]
MAAEAAVYTRAEGSSKSGEASTDSGSAVMNAAITGKAEAPDSIISRKMLMTQLDPLTEQQVMGIYSLQQSSQQAEEALSQLQRSLVDTIAGGPNIIDGVQQMAMAVGKLANLEGFVRQADNLRQQMLHQLGRILTVRQAARCFLVVGEYYGRLRALSSPWATRPRGYV